MSELKVVVIGASAGGVEALSRLASQLPADLPAAVLVVIHFPETSTSVLPAILSRSGPLPAEHAVDGEQICHGRIFVAPPGRHLIIHGGNVHLVNGPRENGNRPAIDPLFRSAARSFGPRVIGVLLSGMLDDGTLGMASIMRHGGTSIVQDPNDALFSGMPQSAIETVAIDCILRLDEIGPAIERLLARPVADWEGEMMPDPTEFTLAELQTLEAQGMPSAYVCPECNGTLFELTEEGITHFRCRVGHTYMPDTLANHQEDALEAALWTALRAVKEHNALLADMLLRAENRGFATTAKNFRGKLEEGQRRLELLTRVLGLSLHRPGQRQDATEVIFEDQRFGMG